jgi:hypothetical protein
VLAKEEGGVQASVGVAGAEGSGAAEVPADAEEREKVDADTDIRVEDLTARTAEQTI